MVEMSDEATRENKACEAVVLEFRSFLAQNNMPEPILKLCDELAGRIQLRRFLLSHKPTTPTEREQEG